MARVTSYGATDQHIQESALESALESSRESGRSREASPDVTIELDYKSDEDLDRLPPGFRSILIPQVVYILINYAFLSFIDQCFQVLQPLMYSTSIPLGGLGFTPYTIGVIMSVWGILNGLIQVFAFAPIRALVGQRNLWRMAIGSHILSIGAFPLMNWLTKMEGKVWWGVWVILIIQFACYPFSYFGFGENPA
jgi:hypothetical protein